MSDNNIEWVVDVAASYHASSQKEFFSTFQAGDFGTVNLGNSSFSKIVGIGVVHIQTNVGCTMVLKDVRHVPNLCLNLISGITLDRQGYENYFGKGISRGKSKSRGRSRGRSQDRGKSRECMSRLRFECYHYDQEGNLKKYCYALKGE